MLTVARLFSREFVTLYRSLSLPFHENRFFIVTSSNIEYNQNTVIKNSTSYTETHNSVSFAEFSVAWEEYKDQIKNSVAETDSCERFLINQLSSNISAELLRSDKFFSSRDNEDIYRHRIFVPVQLYELKSFFFLVHILF